MTLFHNLPEINWCIATNFCDQDVDYLKNRLQKMITL